MIIQDSAKFWLPRITTNVWLNEFVPRTALVEYNQDALAQSLRGKHTTEYERLYYIVAHEAKQIGYPVFIRTDITSAKHAGKSAWKVVSEEELNFALLTTLSASELKTTFQPIKASAILVREFLDLGTSGRTAFNGLPIGREFRLFADQNGLQCWHSYWPEEALTGKMDDGGEPEIMRQWSDGWINTDVIDAAVTAAKAMGAGKWSIDFAHDVQGSWWLLDMATAGNSYHATCQHKDLDKENELC
jgi:hypothetical protein